MKITISKGNNKIGNIPNISLVPVKDCGNCNACKKDCYALKAYRMYPSVRKAWNANSKAFRADLKASMLQLDEYLEAKKPKLFRYHVAGDILNQEHLNYIIEIAKRHPGTQFLCFTKMHSLNYANKPINLSIVFSMFPAMPVPDTNLPIAWLQDGTEKRIPGNAHKCHGMCENCGICWYLKNGNHVYFEKH